MPSSPSNRIRNAGGNSGTAKSAAFPLGIWPVFLLCLLSSQLAYQLGRITSETNHTMMEQLLAEKKLLGGFLNSSSKSSDRNAGCDSATSASPPREKYAYVTNFQIGTSYMCGAAMAAWGLRNRRPDIDIAVFVSGFLGNATTEHPVAMEYLEKLGFKVYHRPLLLNPYNYSDPGFPNRRFNYCKMNMFSLTDYTKIVYMDADVYFTRGAPDRLFDLHKGYPKVAGRMYTKTDMNSGLMVLRPNQTMYLDMLTKFHEFESETGGDQGFLNLYFNTYQQGFEPLQEEALGLKRILNTNRKAIPANRSNVPDRNFYFHPMGLKPWMCPRDVYCERDLEKFNRYVWPQMVQFWWAHFDQMTKEWPWILDDKFKHYCITEKTDVNFTLTKQEWLKQKQEYELEKRKMRQRLRKEQKLREMEQQKLKAQQGKA